MPGETKDEKTVSVEVVIQPALQEKQLEKLARRMRVALELCELGAIKGGERDPFGKSCAIEIEVAKIDKQKFQKLREALRDCRAPDETILRIPKAKREVSLYDKKFKPHPWWWRVSFDDSVPTGASNPGRLKLSDARLRLLCPELYGVRGMMVEPLLNLIFRHDSSRKIIKQHLNGGDCRAAIVVSTSPLLVAAYTDEFDCIALLRFPDALVDHYRLTQGKRLITSNTYGEGPNHLTDLALNPGYKSSWTVFHPVIADFVSNDRQRLITLKEKISEEEWKRVYTLGVEYVEYRPGIARDGHPINSVLPANHPHCTGGYPT